MSDYDIAAAFAKIEDELISSMIRNFKNHRAMETAEGFAWEQWQVLQLKALEDYRKRNQKKFKPQFSTLNFQIEELIRRYFNDGQSNQERKILQAIKRGYKPPHGTNKPPYSGETKIGAEFFKVNERKLNALIKATTNDMSKAETAVLRMANDQYRKIIFDAQVYANAGGTTYEKAVDMATRDFLSSGINCVTYSNGARHTISDYADMAIRTANKRAYLQGEGVKRHEWDIHTVIVNKRTNACPLCVPFVGRIFIDDVYSGSGVKGGKYPLLSTAIAAGFLHPRCRDSYTTYFEGVSTPPERLTQAEIDEINEKYKEEQKRKAAKRAAEKKKRLNNNSLEK